MIEKIKHWFKSKKTNSNGTRVPYTFTREQLEKAYVLGYNDGKRDGLAIAREQATKSLKEILWQQNKTAKK